MVPVILMTVPGAGGELKLHLAFTQLVLQDESEAFLNDPDPIDILLISVQLGEAFQYGFGVASPICLATGSNPEEKPLVPR
ncbi:MAG: hypothetical protein C0406_01865 [Sideroxydans sp.]|nr:hypothetical protein [Sideroxydans sp.]